MEDHHSFNIYEIHKRDLLKEFELRKIYDKILGECKEFILEVYERMGKYQTIYCVPYGVPENTEFDFFNCMVYLISALRNDGFFVKYLKPNMIYISWFNEKKNKRRIENIKKLYLENLETQKLLNGGAKTKKMITYHQGGVL